MGRLKICGVDEAGRGSVIGPMVVAGVLIGEGGVRELGELGVRDSKKLDPERRAELYEKIKEIVDEWRVIVVEAEAVDSSTKRRGAEGLNMLEAKIFAEIIEELKPEVAYIDLPSRNPAGFRESLEKFMKYRCRVILEHKADERYPVVSAASILAKVERDRLIEELKKRLGDFGSGYPSDPRTRRFLREIVLSKKLEGKPIRLSWRTLDKILQRRLDEF